MFGWRNKRASGNANRFLGVVADAHTSGMKRTLQWQDQDQIGRVRSHPACQLFAPGQGTASLRRDRALIQWVQAADPAERWPSG